MAGAFGGNDEEDHWAEDVEDDLEEYDDEEAEETGEESEDGEEDETSDEDEMNAIQKKIFELEEKRLKEKLPKILQKVQSSQLPIIVNPLDKKSYEKAKKHKNLKPQVAAIDLALLAKKAQLASKVMSTVAPALPYIGIGALIVLAIIVAIVAFASMMPWLFPEDDLGGGGAQFGVKGTDFYGVRTIYTDEELAKVGLLEHYSSIIEDVRTLTEEQVYEINRPFDANGDGTVDAGETEKYNVSVKFILPELTVAEGEKFDYSIFVADDLLTNNADLEGYYNLLKAMSEVVYASDNATNVIPTDFNEVLSGIKYFGLNNLLVNTTESNAENDVDDILVNYFANATNYSIIATKEGETEPAGITLTEQEITSLDLITKIKEKVNSILNGIELIRTEKLFIKDYILESDKMMEDVAKENYKTWIFMPNKNVSFEKLSFLVTHEDLNNFEIKAFNNGNEITFKKGDNNLSDLGTEDGKSNTPTYEYVADKLNEQATTFADIDVQNLNALISGNSLIEIVNNSNIDFNLYLENIEGVYTFKNTGVSINFMSDLKFNCIEFETIWK